MVRRDNFFTVQGFMLTDLKLKGNELLIYAIIYGFSQAEGQMFTGSLKYLSEWTNSTSRSVINVLQKLEAKKLITKTEEFVNGVKLCKYQANIENFSEDMKNFHRGSEKFSGGVVKNFHRGSEKFSHNNIKNNINNNINNNIEDGGAIAPVCVAESSKENCNSLIGKIENDELRNAFFEYAKMRKMIKKPLTDYSFKLLANKLNKITSDVTMQIALLNEATLHNWQSVYPPKSVRSAACEKNCSEQKANSEQVYFSRVKNYLQKNYTQ